MTLLTQYGCHFAEGLIIQLITLLLLVVVAAGEVLQVVLVLADY
jgi:hypothetical protein